MEIRQARSSRDRRLLLRFPGKVCKGDSYGVPPLLSEASEELGAWRYPFFEQGKRREAEGHHAEDPFGRIVGIVDRNDNGAVNRFAASRGAAPYKKYRIYEKAISDKGA